MKQLKYADESVLVGDDTAAALVEYAAHLAQNGRAGSVEVRAVTSEGEEVVATFVMGAEVPVTERVQVQTGPAEQPEPDNTELEVRLRAEIARLQPAFMDAPDPLEDPEMLADAEEWAKRSGS